VSKSELRRLEIVAPEAIKQLREQIAREIEAMEFAKGMSTDGPQSGFYSAKKLAAAIARGEK